MIKTVKEVMKDLEFVDLTDEQIVYIYKSLKEFHCVYHDEYLKINFVDFLPETDEMIYEVSLVSENCSRSVCSITR